MDNLNNWKYLQDNGYFAKHNCYYQFQLAVPEQEIIDKITDKVMVDIGCGYGRDTYYFSKYAKLVYAIDVSPSILQLANRFIKKNGDRKRVTFALAENYKDIITKPVDFVYSKHVFQHITPTMAKAYMKFFHKQLKVDGSVDLLFRIGEKKNYPKNSEPLVEYNSEEIKELFQGFKIKTIDKDVQKKYILWRIRANVIKSL